jgi:hypothetical protein
MRCVPSNIKINDKDMHGTFTGALKVCFFALLNNKLPCPFEKLQETLGHVSYSHHFAFVGVGVVIVKHPLVCNCCAE